MPQRDENVARVGYTSSGRGGMVHYISKEASFDLWYEFAGGSALAIINIPTPQEWESVTKIDPSRRDAILNFIGAQVVKDQTNGRGRFEIDDNFLTIYSR